MTKRRHVDLDTVQAVAQVSTEAALLDQHRQGAVGGNHDADVDATRTGASDALDRQVL